MPTRWQPLGSMCCPSTASTRERLEALGLPPGTSVANPIDTPVRTLQERDGLIAGEILDIVYEHAMPDAVVMHLNLAAFVGRGGSDPVDTLLGIDRADSGEMVGRGAFPASAAHRWIGRTRRPPTELPCRLRARQAFRFRRDRADRYRPRIVRHIEMRLAARRMPLTVAFVLF